MEEVIVYNKIVRTVQELLPGSSVLLFGSRARGDHNKHSDYDLLIITPRTFTSKEKIFWANLLDRAIVEAIGAPIDLLLNSEEEVYQKKELPGHIIRTVLREGLRL
jgi:predicted nucleotidyltransferase